jgi:hypothetical protein
MHTQPSRSTTTTGKSKNVRGPVKPLEGCYIILEFNVDTGEPLGQHTQKYKYHCGYLVRDKLPISAREWEQEKYQDSYTHTHTIF